MPEPRLDPVQLLSVPIPELAMLSAPVWAPVVALPSSVKSCRPTVNELCRSDLDRESRSTMTDLPAERLAKGPCRLRIDPSRASVTDRSRTL